MTAIARIEGAVATGRTPAAPPTGGVFVAEETMPKTAAPAAIAPADLTSLLGLQEAGAESERKRRVQRRARDILMSLAALQRAVVAGGDPGAALTELASLHGAVEPSGDPALDLLLQSVRVRARVELARHGL